MHRSDLALLTLSLLALAATVRSASPQGPADHVEACRAVCRQPLAFEDRRHGDAGCDFVASGHGFALHIGAAHAVARLGTPSGDVVTLRCELPGGDPCAVAHALEPLPGRVNYLLGNERSAWRSGIGLCARVRYRDVYPGIDVIYHDSDGELEYDFVVAAGSAPGAIALRFHGADTTSIDAAGDLVLQLGARTVRQRRPVAWQERDGRRDDVPVAFTLADGVVGFRLGEWDRTRELVIDPVLVYSTYFGGSSSDQDPRLFVDAAGHAYIVGYTISAGLPVLNAAQPAHAGSSDLFITKFTPDGAGIVFSTYLGGTGGDIPGDISVASDGRIAVTGYSQSNDFPLQNPFQTVQTGGASAIVTVLDASGSSLLYSTYFTAGGTEQGSAIAWDPGGTVLVAGDTGSAALPVSPGAYQTVKSGLTDVFVARFDPAGGPNSLLAATFLGGNSVDEPWGLVRDGAGNVGVMGRTASSTFPVVNGIQAGFGGGNDAFVAVLDATFSTLLFSTYLGGSGNEMLASVHLPGSLAVDAQGCLYATGDTTSADFITTPGALSTTRSGFRDAFVTKIDPFHATNKLVWSTYLGGSAEDGGQDIAVDAQGCAVVSGFTNSMNFPRPHAIHPAPPGTGIDAFVALLAADGSAVRFGNTMGGVGGGAPDQASGVGVDAAGNVFFAGTTSVFPTTTGSFQPVSGGAGEVFVVRIDLARASAVSYGTGTAGTLGVPSLTASALPVLGTTISCDLANSAGVPTLGIFVVGFAPLAVPVFGGTLLARPDITVAALLPVTGASLPIVIPNDNSFRAVQLFVQGVQFDGGSPQGFSFSAGLALTVGI